MSRLQKHMSGKPQWYKKAAGDPRLSYRAVGLLTFILSQKEGWSFSVKSLGRGEEPGVIKAACQELAVAGYLTREDREGKESITHAADVAFDQWSRRNAAKDYASKAPSPKSVTNNDKAIAAGPVETASVGLELAAPTDLDEYRSQRDSGPTAVARRVMAVWVEAVGMNPARTRLTNERLKVVEARLAEGYEEYDLTMAVRGISMSSWHMGENPEGKKWNDMTLALRSGSHVEKFRTLAEEGGEHKVDASGRALARLREMRGQ